MHLRIWNIVCPVLLLSTTGFAQQSNSCASLVTFKAPGVEISKAAPIAAGTMEPNPWGPGHSAAILPTAESGCDQSPYRSRRRGIWHQLRSRDA